MRARALLSAIVAAVVPGCGLASGDDPGSEATPLPAVTSTTSTTTTTDVPRPALSYDAQLLDGGTITIEEGVGELSEFTQGKPTAIYDLDLLAAIPDCQQLGLSIWEWTAKAGPTDAGMKSSAYAKHGDNLYKFIGCGTPAEPDGPGDPEDLDPRFDTCEEANDAGYVDYRKGIDPEYVWYDDADDDGVVCEGGFGD
jgi:hypothetical protein